MDSKGYHTIGGGSDGAVWDGFSGVTHLRYHVLGSTKSSVLSAIVLVRGYKIVERVLYSNSLQPSVRVEGELV